MYPRTPHRGWRVLLIAVAALVYLLHILVVGVKPRGAAMQPGGGAPPESSTAASDGGGGVGSGFSSLMKKKSRRRPVMYTFYAPIYPDPGIARARRHQNEGGGAKSDRDAESDAESDTGGGNEMTHAEDAELLHLWKTSWEDMGWRAVILSLEDARIHPDYRDLLRRVKSVPLGIKPDYNQYCFLRWMAMSAVGGGWMSDIDVLPLEGSNLLSPKNYGSGTNAEVAWAGSGFGAASYLPNGGALTVHNGHVPCLVSGSGPEWDRMFRAILNEALSHAHERPVETGTMTRGYYSDMISLQNLEEKDTAFFQTTNAVAHGHEIALDTDHPERSPVDCDVLKGMRAIHFSHRSMHHMYGDEDHTGERPRLARIWHDRWKKNCLSSSFV